MGHGAGASARTVVTGWGKVQAALAPFDTAGAAARVVRRLQPRALVVVENELPDKAAEYLRLKAAVGRIGVGVDLLLFARSDFERRSQVPGTLPYRAKKEGRVLHDATA